MLYLSFSRERDTIDQEDSDWEKQGPIVGPCWLTCAFGQLRIHSIDDMQDLKDIEGLYRVNGKYYSDFEVLTTPFEMSNGEKVPQLTAEELIAQLRNPEVEAINEVLEQLTLKTDSQ